VELLSTTPKGKKSRFVRWDVNCETTLVGEVKLASKIDEPNAVIHSYNEQVITCRNGCRRCCSNACLSRCFFGAAKCWWWCRFSDGDEEEKMVSGMLLFWRISLFFTMLRSPQTSGSGLKCRHSSLKLIGAIFVVR
jgi:hypothetical protein